MKKAFILITCASIAVFACTSTPTTTGKDKTADTAAAVDNTRTATPDAANEKGLELIGASDCTTCHRLQKESAGVATGPSYSEVAQKYAPGADTTVTRLVNKVISGGSGVWGTIPMTAHPALDPADVKEMVKYILSLKK